MNNFSEKLVNLKKRVIKAFEGVSVPKDLVAEHKCEECFEIRKTFTGKEWRNLIPKILEANYDKLPLFSPEAYHCFLPAYLVYSLDNFCDNANLDGNLVWEFTGYNFMYNGKVESSHIDWLINRYRNFTKEQLYTIYEFIDLVIQEEKFDDFITERQRGKQLLIDFVEPKLEK